MDYLVGYTVFAFFIGLAFYLNFGGGYGKRLWIAIAAEVCWLPLAFSALVIIPIIYLIGD